MEDEEAQEYLRKIMEHIPDGDKDSYFKQVMESDAIRDEIWREPELTMDKEDKRWEKRKVNQEIAELEDEIVTVKHRIAEEEKAAALKELEIAREKANKERDENEGRPEWGIF